MNKRIKGGDMMVFVAVKSGNTTTVKSIACATSHELNLTLDTKESSSKDSGGVWATYEAGILGWSGKSDNIGSVGDAGLTYDDLVDLIIAREPVHLVFGPKKEAAAEVPAGGWTPADGKGREGDALITSVSRNDQNGENETFSVEFTGTGPLTKVGAETETEAAG